LEKYKRLFAGMVVWPGTIAEVSVISDRNIPVLTDPNDFTDVRAKLDEAGISYENADVIMLPQNTVELDQSSARQTLKLIDALEDNDDVQEVYSNFDISEEVMSVVVGESVG
jgi:transcriptional/translational regulatory protein YebC/TACO1